MLLSLLCGMGIPAFAQVSDTLTVEKEVEKEIHFEMISDRIRVIDLKQEAILEIYNIMGVKVFSRRLPPGNSEYPINLPRGYYIIRIGNTTKKIAIR